MNNLDFAKRILTILGGKLPLNKVPILREWIFSSDTWATKNLLLSSEWVERFIINLKEDNIQLDRFYIHLYGILVDLHQKTGNSLAMIKRSRLQSENRLEMTVERIFKDELQNKKSFLLQLSNAAILKKVLSATTEEKLFKIIYLRNRYSHPYLTEYMVKTYMDADGKEIQFDTKKYKKFQDEDIDVTSLTDQLKASLLPLEEDIQTLSSNLNEMRRL